MSTSWRTSMPTTERRRHTRRGGARALAGLGRAGADAGRRAAATAAGAGAASPASPPELTAAGQFRPQRGADVRRLRGHPRRATPTCRRWRRACSGRPGAARAPARSRPSWRRSSTISRATTASSSASTATPASSVTGARDGGRAGVLVETRVLRPGAGGHRRRLAGQRPQRQPARGEPDHRGRLDARQRARRDRRHARRRGRRSRRADPRRSAPAPDRTDPANRTR